MAELKTKKTDNDVLEYINTIPDEKKRDDCKRIIEMMREVTGEEPKLWGDSIVAFCDFHYKSESGREGDWFRIGFGPRKQNISLYIMSGFSGLEELLAKLGKHKLGKGCLYIKNLEQIDVEVLKEIFRKSLEGIENNDAILSGC